MDLQENYHLTYVSHFHTIFFYFHVWNLSHIY